METTIHVLHLEDDPVDAELVQTRLFESGFSFRITPVATRDEFETILGKGGTDIILADYKLPMYDGMSALRLANEQKPDIPFIFVSGTMGEEVAIDALTRGATDYVLKQNLSRLAPAVQRALLEARNQRERKQAEAEVGRLKNYLANIIDSMPLVLAGIDPSGTVTQWNRRAMEMSGVSSQEAVGRTVVDLLPDFSLWITQLKSDVKQDQPASMEKLLIEKEGRRRFYDLLLYHLVANGVEGSVLCIEDVTEQTRIQEMMVQTEKMMSLGGIAAGMAHEINNPLGIITQALQNIERRVLTDIPANRKAAEEVAVEMDGMKRYFEKRQIPEFIRSIREASARASRIITNILQFSRRPDDTLEPASIPEIIDRVLELAANDYDLKKKYDFRSIEIHRDYGPDIPLVPMIFVEMEQVFLNLIKNAAQAMMENPPDQNPKIILRLGREERYVLIEVADNGPGIPEEVRSRVFEPFFTTKEPGVGTGLGLSVSYTIITRNHKGLMEVASSPGKGTCFKIRIPLERSAARNATRRDG